MSQTQETTDQKQEQATTEPASEPIADEVIIVEGMKPSSALPQAKPAKYGTRKKRAGQPAPAITKISSASAFEEEEIEMDDLPVRASIPEHMIATQNNPSERSEFEDEERPRRNDRSRGERRGRQDRDRAPRKRKEYKSDDATETTEAAPIAAETTEEERPPRFGMVSESNRSETSVQEFRPSRDGRRSQKEKRESAPVRKTSSASVPAPKKKGFLSKIISFFTGDSGEEEKAKTEAPRKGNRSNSNRPRSHRSPQDREKREDGNDRPRRRPRNRNRKPRPEGEKGPREPRAEGADGQPRRRRRPRNRNRNGGGQGKRPAAENSNAS